MPPRARAIVTGGILVCAAILVALAGLLMAKGTSWGGEPSTFRVVDEHNQPVSGAIVLMNWPLIGGISTTPLQQVHVFEGETDADGTVRVPGWGPVRVPRGTYVQSSYPALTIFKPGYLAYFDSNSADPIIADGQGIIPLEWTGKTIALEKADPDSQAYRNRILSLFTRMSFFGVDPAHQCLVNEHHRLVDAYNAEIRRLNPTDDLGMLMATSC